MGPIKSFEQALEENFPCLEERSKARKATLAQAHDIRKFEIDLYWKRTTYFWTLLAAVFAGFFLIQASEELATQNMKQDFSVILALLGFVLSLGWCCVNKGSKFWQENWESVVDEIEDKVTGPLYKFEPPKRRPKGRFRDWFVGSSNFSVSKINLLVSSYVTLVWVGLIVYSLRLGDFSSPIHWWYVVLALLTFAMWGLFVWWGKTDPRG